MPDASVAIIEVSPAEVLRQEIYNQLGAASAHEIVLEQSWMRLGQLLVIFKQQEHWRALGYESFDRFMLELRDTYHRGRTQLWSYLTVAEKLLPVIDAATLETIGVSKALALKRAYAVHGSAALVPEILEAAKQQKTTIKELRAVIGQTLNMPAGDSPGTWFDFDGCFMTPEERKEFVACVIMTKALLGIKNELPEHVQRKEIFLSWMREFFGTHAAEVYGHESGTPAESHLLMPAPEGA